MKTVKFRLVLLMIAAVMALGGCVKGGGQEEGKITVTDSLEGKPVLVGNIPCRFPLADKPLTLNFMSFRSLPTDYEEVYVWKKYEQMTGIDVKWTTASLADSAEMVYTALMNGADVDLILRCRVDSNRLIQYAESGLILDLAKDDLLKENAPNCWAYLQSHPEALASVTNPDGSIYALPQVNSGAELRVSRKIFINKNWLERVNMELPATTEEFYDLLKAFKEQDANGNGDMNDEIPLCSMDWMSVYESFYGAFGLMNRGVHNQVVDCDEPTGKVRFIQSADGYRDFIEYFQRLYGEGLMDTNIFTMTAEEWTNNALNDRIGVFCSTNLASVPANMADNWVGISEALEGPNGDKQWNSIRANLHSTGNALIPVTCENPEIVLRWLDYFWTDEGTLFYHMGIEDETFVEKNDGSYDYAPAIYEELKGSSLSFDEVISRYTPYPGGGNPMVEVAPYFMGGEMAAIPAATARALFAYGPKVYWPIFTFTPEENEKLVEINADVGKYCTDMRIDFIIGKKSMDEWESYITQLNQFRIKELLEIYQAALDRYEKAFGN